MKGLLFSIKKYAIHDGPGIRITFFMKGCSLNCWWCHNPEGISPHKVEVERVDRIGDREFRRMEVVGKEYSAEELLTIAEKERVFFEHSGGGITFSGGEPMMQFEFLKTSLSAFRENGFHTVVDTSGMAPAAQYTEIAPVTSVFLYDLKHLDDSRHKEFTGVSNKQILSNFVTLLENGSDIIVRIPIIPGLNDDEKNLRGLSDFLGKHESPNMIEVDLLPFHRIGKSKYTRFWLPYRMGDTMQPPFERMNELSLYFSNLKAKIKVGG